MPKLNAGSDPALANKVINDILAGVVSEENVEPDNTVQGPPELVLTLPGGYITATGEVVTEVEIRELTGRDEEAIAKTSSIASTLQMVLQRGLVRVGNEVVTEKITDYMLSGDRDWALLNIYVATFGDEVTLTPYCVSCGERVTIKTSLLSITPNVLMDDPAERHFPVSTGKGTVVFTYPNGKVQRAMLVAGEKTGAELSTILLQGCIEEINGMPVLRDSQILDMPIRDRRKIAEAIMEKIVGPQMQDITVDCPQCAAVLEVPLSMAALFQF